MTALIETTDTFLDAGRNAINGIMQNGDTFDGTLTTKSDVSDAVTLGSSLVGEKYTVSVTFDSLDGLIVFNLTSIFEGAVITYQIQDGVLSAFSSTGNYAPGTFAQIILVNPLEFKIEGNTLTFDYAPLTVSEYSFEIYSDLSDKSYSIDYDIAAPEANIITGDVGDDRLNGTDTADVADLGDGADH